MAINRLVAASTQRRVPTILTRSLSMLPSSTIGKPTTATNVAATTDAPNVFKSEEHGKLYALYNCEQQSNYAAGTTASKSIDEGNSQYQHYHHLSGESSSSAFQPVYNHVFDE